MYDDNGVEEVEKGDNDDNVEEGDDCDESRNCSSTPSPAEAEFCIWRIYTDAAVRQHTISFHLGEEVGNNHQHTITHIITSAHYTHQHTISFHLGEEVGNHQRRQNLNI